MAYLFLTLFLASVAINIYFLRAFLIERYVNILIEKIAHKVAEGARAVVAQSNEENIELRKLAAQVLERAGMAMEVKDECAVAISLYQVALGFDPDNRAEICSRIELLKSQGKPPPLLS